MKCDKINLFYFSATGTTDKITKAIGDGTGISTMECVDITQGIEKDIHIPSDTVALFGMPVYSGRIPQIMVEHLHRISGNNTPAIITCVYGNRDYDDAVLELRDIVEKNGFHVISASTFIAQHSIFPQVAQGRPDESDICFAKEFGRKSIEILNQCDDISTMQQISVKGNYPYRAIAPIPLKPKTDKRCNACGLCAKQCPTQAINKDKPKETDKTKCISCAHCIAVCPIHARHFGGLLYGLVARKFNKKCSLRQEPHLIYAQIQK